MLAAKDAAARLKKGDTPTLAVEIVTERAEFNAGLHGHGPRSSSIGPSSPDKSPEKSAKHAKTVGEELGEPTLAISLERGSICPGGKLPERLVGSAAASMLTNASGGPILGHLSIGGAKLMFALYDVRERHLLPASTELTQSGHAPPNPKLLEAIRGLAMPPNGTRATGAMPSGCFIAHPHDGFPVQRLTVVDSIVGVAVEATIHGRMLRAFVRKASVAETRRAEASETLREAEMGTSYDRLHGSIVAARARGVDARRLDAAQARLKTLQPDVAAKDELVATLRWPLVTASSSHSSGVQTGEEVCSLPGCTVGDALDGETLSFVPTAASDALKALKTDGVPHDQWLFERISEAAAAAAAEGGVWRSGGKFILSAITRNQSPTALHRYLLSINQSACAEGIAALVKWTEDKYRHHVSAIQINVHIDSSCFHAQHRDIYGLEQRDMAGRDCTCSFKPNIATACLSLGSTRKCLVEAETDDFSQLKKCGPDCKGYKCNHWLRSGSLMYFNDVWNRSHNHGIPINGGDADENGAGGPRISVAMLCSAADDDPLQVCAFMPKAKNIYATLVEKNKEKGL